MPDRDTQKENGSKELDKKLPGVWHGKKVQTIKSGDVKHDYKVIQISGETQTGCREFN